MEKNNELKKVDIKSHTCCYFDDITKIQDFDFDGYIRDYGGTKYFSFIWIQKYDAIFDNINILQDQKGVLNMLIFIIIAKIDSDDDLPLEKTLTMHNDVMVIKSVFNKNHNQYYYKMFLEK